VFNEILLALLLSGSQSPDYQPNCANPETQLDMNLCSARAAAAADAELNRLWPRVREHLQAQDREFATLRSADRRPGYWQTALNAQRSWLGYRDRQCALEGYEARGGTLEAMLVALCRERLTRARIVELNAVIEEG
jgi:uncharacterized protein YecT (DUF1311 family)